MTSDADIELIVRIVVRVLAGARPHAPPAPAAAPATAAPGVGSAAPPSRRSARRRRAAVDAGVLHLARGAVVTPLAREAAEAKGVRLVGAA